MAGTALAAALATVGCGSGDSSSGSGSGSEAEASVVRDVPLVYVKRANILGMNPTDGAPSAPGGDLMVREKSSPSAPEHNLTARFTQGKGDASDPEVVLRRQEDHLLDALPELEHLDPRRGERLHGSLEHLGIRDERGRPDPRPLQAADGIHRDDDVDPAYLPAGRGVVFASNRQAKSEDLAGRR